MKAAKTILLSFSWVLSQTSLAAAGDPGAGRVVINELLAANVKSIADPQGEYDDWLELYNPGDEPVDVGGMYLTDDVSEPTKWRIPTGSAALTTIAAKGYLVIWADKDVTPQGLHASFSLGADGEELALVDADGVTILDGVRFDEQRADVSYGRCPDGSDTWLLTAIPTPGGPAPPQADRLGIRIERGLPEGLCLPGASGSI